MARNPLWFGISYSAYMLLSVVGWKRVRREMSRAIRASRDNLRNEPDGIRDIYSGALEILDRYYVRQKNLLRVWSSFVLGMVGLLFSLLALMLGRTSLDTIAYSIFILSILAFEVGLASYWRFRLYTGVRPFEIAKDDYELSKRRKRVKSIHTGSRDSHDSKGLQ